MGTKLDASQLEGMKKSDLIALITSLMSGGDGEKPAVTSGKKYITIMSLVPYKLNLSTLPYGKGRRFTFHRFGEKKKLYVDDLIDVIEHYHAFLEKGFFYILDAEFVEEHGLTEIYKKILTNEKILQIIECDPAEAVSLYESANEDQRHFVNELFISKMVAEEQVDMNVLAVICRIGGVDLFAQAENRKSKLKELKQ